MVTVSAVLEAAVSHHQSGDLQQTEDLCRLIIRIDPKQPDALYLLGSSAHQRGRTEEAIEYINRAIAVSEAAAPFHCELGGVYRSLLRFDDALESYEEAARVSPENAEAQFHLAEAAFEFGNLEKAGSFYLRGLELDPDFVEGRIQLAEILELQQRFAEAVEHYQLAIKQRPDSAILHYKLAEICLQNGQLDEAIEHYHKTVNLDSNAIRSSHAWRRALRALVKVDELSRRIRQNSDAGEETANRKLTPNEVLTIRRELSETIQTYETAIETQHQAAGVLQHLLEQITRANSTFDPVFHFSLENIFPDGFFDMLIEHLPADESYTQPAFPQLNLSNEAITGNTFSLAEESIRTLPQSLRDFWTQYSALFYSRHIRCALFSKFRREIPGNLQVILTRGLSRTTLLSRPVLPENTVALCCTLKSESNAANTGIAFQVTEEQQQTSDQPEENTRNDAVQLLIVFSNS